MSGRPAKGVVEHIGELTYNAVSDFIDLVGFTGALALAGWESVRNPRKIRWRETLYYMDLCGGQTLPIVILMSFMTGVIMGFQGAIQLSKYGADIFLADGVGVVMFKEFGALMVALIATGRAGSAFAAEIGTMQASEEVDALKTMGFSASRFLVIPKVLALLVVMPILTIFSDFCGLLGGLFVGVFMLNIPVMAYINRTFVALNTHYFLEGMIKSVVYALLIALVGCLRGFQAERDAQGVGRATTSAVVTSIFMIFLADALLTFIFIATGF